MASCSPTTPFEIRSRVTRFFSLLAGCLFSGAMFTVPAQAGDTAFVQISAVLASRDNTTFDPRLASLRPELRGLPFKGYQLLGIQSCRLETGDQCAMEIPGGGYLHVTTTQTTDRHLKMRLLLNQQNRPLFNADIKLNRNAGILLKMARTDMGTIILSLRASGLTPPNTHASGLPPSDTGGPVASTLR